jgi:hypothetical protein
MSMRINSLFEHDALMKRQAEESPNIMPGTVYERDGGVDLDPPKSTKGEKGRHRASIACAACRDRRIRVCRVLELDCMLLIMIVCCTAWTTRLYSMPEIENGVYH